MHDDGASWKAQVQAALAARQRLESYIQALGTLPAWTPVRTAFANLFTVLEELWQEVQAAPDRLQALPESLRKHVLAVSDWQELEKEKPIELLVDLWQGWTTGILAARYFQEESELRAELLWLYRKAGLHASDLKDFAIAVQLNRQGITHGEHFFEAGEILLEPDLQRELLALYFNAGYEMHEQGDRMEADRIYRLGINHGKVFFEVGKIASKVQERLLDLYVNAGSNTADEAEAAKLYREGISYGERFVEAGEISPRVREALLTLYVNAGSNTADEAEAAKLYREGIVHCQWLFEAGEFLLRPEVQAAVLIIHLNLGSYLFNFDKFAANKIFRQGVTYGEHFFEVGNITLAAQKILLRLYNNVGVTMSLQNHIVAADQLFRQGIARGEQFIILSDTNLEVRESLLKLLLNASINTKGMLFSVQGWSWYYRVLFNALEWQWDCIKDYIYIDDMIRKTKLDFSSTSNLLQWWYEVIYTFLFNFHNEKPYPEQSTYNILIVISKALLLQTNAQDNQFCKYFEKWITLQEQIADKLDDWKDRLEQQRQHLEDTVSRRFPEDRPELENLASRFVELPWWERIRHPLAYHRIQQEVRAYQKLIDQPVITDDLRSKIQNCQQLFVDWPTERWLDYHEIPGELEEPGLALLGIVFAAHCKDEKPETILNRWQAIQPWADPKDLNDTMTLAGWAKVVLPHDDDAFTLHDWTERIGQFRLTIAEATLNFAGPALIPTLRAYQQGNVEPLQRTLEYAWTQAQEKALTFARLLRGLSSVQGTVESCVGSEPPPTEQEVRTALAALVLGDTRAVLAKALHGRLDQQWPLTPDTPLAAAQLCLKRRFSTLVSLSPGPRHHRELAERLHAWCQQALRRELAAPAPDVTEIWNTLEHGRVALLGLKVRAPDPAWEEETARQIHAVLQHTPIVPPRPGLIWPPFQCWLDRLKEAGLLPELPTVADGQHRLRADEALVRLFFDPGSGHLFALWLEPDRTVELHRFDSATDWPHWRAFDDDDPAVQDRRKRWEETAKKWGLGGDDAEPGVLDRWERWLEKEQSRPFPAVFHKVMTSPAVTTVVDTLQAWCRQTDRTRLIILLPAPLAQLPWEVLPPFDSGQITLERAVSLSHWRVTPDEMTQDGQDPQEETSDPPPLGVFFDSQPNSVILAEWQAQRAGDFWNRAVLGTGEGLTAFDILTHLHRHANGHLLLHGEYRQDDPRRSHLKLQSDEHLYAWTASAVGVRGGLFGLAACQANLSGATTQTLLASVGLGPALIASGAAAVIGPLWSCNQWAALAFFHRLFELARQEPKEPWSKLLQRARQDLKQLSKVDLLKLFKDNHLAEAEQQFKSFLDNYPELGDPPFGDNPFYWAPFILLGDDRRTDSHGIDSKTC